LIGLSNILRTNKNKNRKRRRRRKNEKTEDHRS